jgi:hypothetical protein
MITLLLGQLAHFVGSALQWTTSPTTLPTQYGVNGVRSALCVPTNANLAADWLQPNHLFC